MIHSERALLRGRALEALEAPDLLRLKQLGYSDRQIAWSTGSSELAVRSRRHQLDVRPVFKTVDTCAAEFASTTPYHYATYEQPLEQLAPMVTSSGCRMPVRCAPKTDAR